MGGIPTIVNRNYFIRPICGIERILVHEGFELRGQAGYLRSHVEQIPFRNIDQYLGKMDRYSTLRAEVMHQQGRRFYVHQLMIPPILYIYENVCLSWGCP